MAIVRSMLVVFPEIKVGESILKFRSFVNYQLGSADDLFHNHADEKNSVIYRYPRIHYRNCDGAAAMFGIHEGYHALNELLNNKLESFPEKFQYFERKEQRIDIALSANHKTYQLNNWLGLNTTRNRDGSFLVREEIFEELNSVTEQKEMLRAILLSQLLAFCREIGLELPLSELWVEILHFQSTGKHAIVSQTGTSHFTCFRLQYKTNLVLPDYVAFGKAVSKGFGWQKTIR